MACDCRVCGILLAAWPDKCCFVGLLGTFNFNIIVIKFLSMSLLPQPCLHQRDHIIRQHHLPLFTHWISNTTRLERYSPWSHQVEIPQGHVTTYLRSATTKVENFQIWQHQSTIHSSLIILHQKTFPQKLIVLKITVLEYIENSELILQNCFQTHFTYQKEYHFHYPFLLLH